MKSLSIVVVIPQTFSFLTFYFIILSVLDSSLSPICSFATVVINRHTAKLEATTRKYNSILKRKRRKVIVPAHVTIKRKIKHRVQGKRRRKEKKQKGTSWVPFLHYQQLMSHVQPVNTLFQSCWLVTYHANKMLFSVEQVFVRRDEMQAPLKTPAWEAS